MSHVKQDYFESAWLKINSAENYVERDELVKSLDIIEDAYQDVEKACRNIDTINQSKFYNKKSEDSLKIQNSKSSGIEEDFVREIIQDLRNNMKDWKEKVEEWFRKNDMSYEIKLYDGRTSNDYLY